MAHLSEFVSTASQQGRDVFARIYPHPFLLLKRSVEEPSSSEDWSFQTRTALGAPSQTWDNPLSVEAERYRVFALVKASRNPWPERISLGRARNNDVVLPDTSVSKLHAHFMYGEDGGMLLADAGSRNGTRVNERVLLAGERVAVKPGDAVMVGGLILKLLDARGLYDLIHTVRRKK